jgi:tRNA(Ile2)-agmatinylcytidine synthase
LVNDLITEFEDYNLVEYPYLVRLNPNIPWKTRGNGAICININRKIEGTGLEVGSVKQGTTVLSYQKSDIISNEDKFETKNELKETMTRVDEIVSKHGAFESETTNPGFVITDDHGLPLDLYWSAVRSVVDLQYIKNKLDNIDVIYKGFKKGRGIIGASAAIAWATYVAGMPKSNDRDHEQEGDDIFKNQPGLDFTFELISYRTPSRWGTQREINPEAVITLDKKFLSTFNNYDYESNHVSISPNSPCPVLFGIRGEDSDDLLSALSFIRSHTESIDKWLLFKTNQGTDDHLMQTKMGNVKPFSSVILNGRVKESVHTISGGHVFFELEEVNPGMNINSNDNLTITCAAYEPTKGFRNIIRDLLPGDIIRVFGGVRDEPRTLNIEKIEVMSMVNRLKKTRNPKCPKCGKNMKSIGNNKGYRCRKCHVKTDLAESNFIKSDRPLNLGYYEVPVSARRHLSKPLKRYYLDTGS